jgi:hypothetical protein
VLPRGGSRQGMRREVEEGQCRRWLHASRSKSLAEVIILDLVAAVLGAVLPAAASALGRKALALWEAAREKAHGGPTQHSGCAAATRVVIVDLRWGRPHLRWWCPMEGKWR